ncbi:Adenylosuccinate lyase [Buchnera aphidicola (Tetraneura ulmi)]|uniref:adenylosuccinate lyase n=1 Tax=Buchnera aphidicola TaxID=9 RepID=UPI00346480B5
MKYDYLTTISPIDGRYFNKTNCLRAIFSEYSFLKFRLKIEIKWLQKLSEINEILELPKFDDNENNFLNKILKEFDEKDAFWIKSLENKINHDVKSLEYFLKKKINSFKCLKSISEFVHFACTSEDINNLSYGLMLKKSKKELLLPIWETIILEIKNLVVLYKDIPMLSRTHGQAATTSTFGKEMSIFLYRMNRQKKQLKNIKILGKFNGSTGNYNSHFIAYPNVDWIKISKDFVSSLGLEWNPCTTQIEPHDYISEIFSCIVRFNLILLDFNKDIWSYISMNYLKQKESVDVVGSSVMPHKINPINFENSEGNLGLSNSIMIHMIKKLMVSRLQRDLSDSTVLRNIGTALSYSYIAYDSSLIGIKKLKLNKNEIFKDLDKHWEILSEPIQTIMRKYKICNSYEKMKFFTKGKKINREILHIFINKLKIPIFEKEKLKKLTPKTYLGLSKEIVNNCLKLN